MLCSIFQCSCLPLTMDNLAKLHLPMPANFQRSTSYGSSHSAASFSSSGYATSTDSPIDYSRRSPVSGLYNWPLATGLPTVVRAPATPDAKHLPFKKRLAVREVAPLPAHLRQQQHQPQHHHQHELQQAPLAAIVCTECGKQFSNKIRFRAHLRRHSSKTSGRYQCKCCAKTFVQRSSLTTHMRIHSGERPFCCGDCSESFGDFSTFTKHKRVHTGEKPYPCPVCCRKFSQSGNMHRHLKAVHGSLSTSVGSGRPATATVYGQW